MQTVTENKTGAQMAAEYAEGIIEDLTVLDVLVDGFYAVVDYLEAVENCDPADADDAETLTETRDDAESACGSDAALVAAARLYRELGEPANTHEAVAAWVDGIVDVEVNGTHNGHGWEVTEIAFLVAFGGPTARVVWDGSSKLAVRCSWWSQEVTRRVECGPLSDWAEEYAEAIN